MSDPITISPADAARVEAAEPFVVAGEWFASILHSPAVWTEAAKACEECRGSGWVMPDYRKLDCFLCHGTGRTVVELWEACECQSPTCQRRSRLGQFTIGVLPIVEHHQPHPFIRSTTANRWWLHRIAKEGRVVQEYITLPPAAKPGMYAVIATKVPL